MTAAADVEAACAALFPASNGALLLAGAHHRVGSELLTRLMDALCRRCSGRGERSRRRGRRGMPAPVLPPLCVTDASTSRKRAVNGRADDVWNVSRLAGAQGLRLFGSGQWAIPLRQLSSALGAAGRTFRMVHLIRDPFALVVSAYFYHRECEEPWALERDPKWYSRASLTPPLPPGRTYQAQLLRLNATDGVILQAQHSLPLMAEMVATAIACDGLADRCTNVWLDAFQSGSDGAWDHGASQVLRALLPPATGGAPARIKVETDLLQLMRAAGRLSDRQRAASKHVTTGKHGADASTLVRALQKSPYGAAMRRMRTRLDGKSGTSTEASCSRLVAAQRLRGGWWDSGDPLRVAWIPSAADAQRDAEACCNICLEAVDPGCLYFNMGRTTPAAVSATAAATSPGRPSTNAQRCTLLSTRRTWHRSLRASHWEA